MLGLGLGLGLGIVEGSGIEEGREEGGGCCGG